MQGVFNYPIPSEFCIKDDGMNEADQANVAFINGKIGMDEWVNRLEKFAKAKRK